MAETTVFQPRNMGVAKIAARFARHFVSSTPLNLKSWIRPCIDYTTYLHSPNYECGESTLCQYGPLFYILSEIIPVTGIFLTILFFNINLTSGALYSFIFYSQIVNNHYSDTLYQSYNGPLNYFLNAFKIFYGIIFDLDIFEINQLSFCLFKNATILDLMLIKYLTTLYALFLIIVTILVLRFYSFYCCMHQTLS